VAFKSTLAGLFDDLVRCETRLYNAANDRLRERHGIVTSQFELLRYVRDQPGTRVADLSAAFAIGIGAASKGVDRAEQRGWVARQANPADRRSSLLVLTADGQKLTDAAEKTLDELLEQLIGSEIGATVPRFFATLRAALEDDRVGMPTG
jgi:MarR family transcriptional regulator, multiple antibiotic resistance protein MarR